MSEIEQKTMVLNLSGDELCKKIEEMQAQGWEVVVIVPLEYHKPFAYECHRAAERESYFLRKALLTLKRPVDK